MIFTFERKKIKNILLLVIYCFMIYGIKNFCVTKVKICVMRLKGEKFRRFLQV